MNPFLRIYTRERFRQPRNDWRTINIKSSGEHWINFFGALGLKDGNDDKMVCKCYIVWQCRNNITHKKLGRERKSKWKA